MKNCEYNFWFSIGETQSFIHHEAGNTCRRRLCLLVGICYDLSVVCSYTSTQKQPQQYVMVLRFLAQLKKKHLQNFLLLCRWCAVVGGNGSSRWRPHHRSQCFCYYCRYCTCDCLPLPTFCYCMLNAAVLRWLIPSTFVTEINCGH